MQLRVFAIVPDGKVGVHARIAVATIGAGGEIDTEVAKQSVIGFILEIPGL